MPAILSLVIEIRVALFEALFGVIFIKNDFGFIVFYIDTNESVTFFLEIFNNFMPSYLHIYSC